MDLAARHFTFGWRALLFFLSLGLVLEMLHGLKVEWYLSTSLATRRHMWTLAHAHGGLLALINIAFAAYVPWRLEHRGPLHAWCSPALLAASLLLPGGFLLGGIDVRGGDPGVGILLSPVGGLLLLVAVYLCAAAPPAGRRDEG